MLPSAINVSAGTVRVRMTRASSLRIKPAFSQIASKVFDSCSLSAAKTLTYTFAVLKSGATSAAVTDTIPFN